MNYKFKLNNIITASFFLLLVTLTSSFIVQYNFSKKTITDNYQNKYYNQTLHVREDFRIALDKVQYNFKITESQNIKKLNQLYEIYKTSTTNFDINKTVEILNKDVQFGKYQIFLINKDKVIEDTSYKNDIGLDLGQFKLVEELLQSIFDKKINIDVSVPILDSLSMNLKKYIIRLSHDEKYILQIGFVLDINEILNEIDQKAFNSADEVNLYLATEFSFQKIQKKTNQIKNISLKEHSTSTKIFFTNLNTYLKRDDIRRIINTDIQEETINFNKILTKLFINDDKLLYFEDNNDNKIHYYSITNGLFNNNDELKLIINLNYSRNSLQEDINRNFLYLIIIILIFTFILTLTYIFVVYYISNKILHLTEKMNENKIVDEKNIIVKEIYELKKTYNNLHNDLNNQIILNKELSYIDSLTKAKNRKAYDEKILELLSTFNRYQTIFSMIILDIDNFKYINDTYGHRIGDNVLINIVTLINSIIRSNDFLFRVGGEEFVILYEHTSLESSKIITEKIRKSIEDNLNTIDNERITVSIGLSEAKLDDTEDVIYKRVDTLLYKSKNNGKNKVSY